MANYTSRRTCSYCGQSGHNRRTCPQLAKSEWGKRQQQRSRESASNRRCGFCNQKGHTARTCPVKRAMIDEATARMNDVRSVWLEKRRSLGMGEHSMVKVYPLIANNRYRSEWAEDKPTLLMVGIDDGYQPHRCADSAGDRGRAFTPKATLSLNCYEPQGITRALEIKNGRGHWYHLSGHTDIQISMPTLAEAQKDWDLTGTWTADSWVAGGQSGLITEEQMREKALEMIKTIEEDPDGNTHSYKQLPNNWKKFQEYCNSSSDNMTMALVGETVCLVEVVSATKVAEDYSDRETWAEWYNQFSRGKDNNYRDFQNIVTNKTYAEQRAAGYGNTWWLDELKARFNWSEESR